MPTTPADANTSFPESEAAFNTVEGTSMVPAQVRVHILPLRQTSDFSPSRMPPPRAMHVLFVTFAAPALDGHKM